MKFSMILILIGLLIFSLFFVGCNSINQNKPLKQQNVSPSPSPGMISPSASPGLISPSPSTSPAK